jgi:hypothetical protein
VASSQVVGRRYWGGVSLGPDGCAPLDKAIWAKQIAAGAQSP